MVQSLQAFKRLGINGAVAISALEGQVNSTVVKLSLNFLRKKLERIC